MNADMMQELHVLSLHDPYVQAAMTYFRRGDYNMETCLAMATIALSKANTATLAIAKSLAMDNISRIIPPDIAYLEGV